MDTWADNESLINYYKSFGFKLIENYKTTNAPELPMQNRNLNVALLEIKLSDNKNKPLITQAIFHNEKNKSTF